MKISKGHGYFNLYYLLEQDVYAFYRVDRKLRTVVFKPLTTKVLVEFLNDEDFELAINNKDVNYFDKNIGYLTNEELLKCQTKWLVSQMKPEIFPVESAQIFYRNILNLTINIDASNMSEMWSGNKKKYLNYETISKAFTILKIASILDSEFVEFDFEENSCTIFYESYASDLLNDYMTSTFGVVSTQETAQGTKFFLT